MSEKALTVALICIYLGGGIEYVAHSESPWFQGYYVVMVVVLLPCY